MQKSTKRINDLLDEQQAILSRIKAEALEFDSDNLTKENERLTFELDKANKKAQALETENESLKKELDFTKSALFTKMAQEKLAVFERRQREVEQLYYQQGEMLESRLDSYAHNCIISLNATIKAIESYGCAEFDGILARLQELRAEAEHKKSEVDAYKAQQLNNAKQTNFAIGDTLKHESLTEIEKRTAEKHRSIEAFIGLNILSKAGILLFIIGIIMLGRFAYVHMSDALKGGLIYLLAIALVGIGELFHRKEKTIFSTTLMSGGVATLYAACATSYFAFNLYSIRATFIICIVITAIAIVLSNQIKSQIVCGFAAVGGYLPVVVIYMIGFGKAAADITFLPVSSTYFCILAAIIFLMTYNKRWHIAQFIGYGLHLIAIGGIAKCAYSLKSMTGYEYALPLASIFALISFGIYLLMPAMKIVKRKPFTMGDLVLLTLNTISGAISVSITVRNCISGNIEMANRVMGFVFLAFASVYAVLMAFSVREKKEGSSSATIITSVSALVFSMLVIPLVFGFEYTAIGWVVEGVVLALISLEKQLKFPEITGLLCMILSVPVSIYYSTTRFSVLSVVTFSVILSAFWLYTVRGIIAVKAYGENSVVYYTCEILSAFASSGYIYYLYSCALKSPSVSIYCDFTNVSVAIISVIFALVVLRLGLFRNEASIIISDIGGIIIFFVALIGANSVCRYNETINVFGDLVKSQAIWIMNLALLIAVNITVELLLARSVFDIINRLSAPVWIFTMTVSVSILALLTAMLLNHFDIKFSSVIISAVYIAVACLLLFIGFRKNYTVVRSSGLVLVLCAFAKLCFVDTSSLDSGWKIASYFAFGALLIMISFFYQRFSKRIENK